MEKRIENLEIHVGYLQKGLDDLNAAVLEQARQLREIVDLLAAFQRVLADVVATVQESGEQEDKGREA